MDARAYVSAGFSAKQVGADGVPFYTFVITTDRIDRQGEIVTLDGWDFTAYLTNPVVLDSHSYSSIESIVGRCIGINRSADGWTADIRFNGSEYGALAQSLVDGGDLRAVSVGFRPLAIEYPDLASLRASRTVDDETMKSLVSIAPDPSAAIRHVQKELLEISVVPIPANADAIRIRSIDDTAAMVANSKESAVEIIRQEIPIASFEDAVWPPVASAMLAVLTDTGASDAVRRRAYNGLERVYKTLDREPPDFVSAETVAKLGMAERLGLFWEGEADHVKVDRAISGPSEMRLRQALDLITQVLASMGGGDTPVPEVPAPAVPYGGEGLVADLDALRAFLESRE